MKAKMACKGATPFRTADTIASPVVLIVCIIVLFESFTEKNKRLVKLLHHQSMILDQLHFQS